MQMYYYFDKREDFNCNHMNLLVDLLVTPFA
jgi:hypothetical protein